MVEGHDELIPDIISRRLMLVKFAINHTTALTITSAIFDLHSSPHSLERLKGIWEEAKRVSAEKGGQWTRNSLSVVDKSPANAS